MRPTWRLILDGPVPGARSMALDRAVVRARARGDVPATVRLYTWEVPTVTIGRFQREDDVDRDACRQRGFDVVRRPTGGRGVLHDREVTYSVAASTADGVPRGVAASYRHLCAALAEAYRLLGVDAALTARPRGTAGSAACYLHATAADLSLGAAKLSGSAQVWHEDAVLQHGSFVIDRDTDAEAAAFGLSADDVRALAGSTATLRDALGRDVSFDEVAAALRGAFGTVLGVDLVEGAWTEAETGEADETAAGHAILTASRDHLTST